MRRLLLFQSVRFLWVLAFSLMAVNPLVSFAQQQTPAPNAEGQPQMLLEVTEHDAGIVYEGAVVTHTFTVKNLGKVNLLINQVRPG